LLIKTRRLTPPVLSTSTIPRAASPTYTSPSILRPEMLDESPPVFTALNPPIATQSEPLKRTVSHAKNPPSAPDKTTILPA